MELVMGVSVLLGFWMNLCLWFDFRNKSKLQLNKLHAARTLVGFQVILNIWVLVIHFALLIPWPFWGYVVNPSNKMWTVFPLVCRMFSAIEQASSMACATNAVAMIATSEGQDEKAERKRKIAFLLVRLETFVGSLLAIAFGFLLPLLKFEMKNCPASSLLLLSETDNLKYFLVTYVLFSVICLSSLRYRSNLKAQHQESCTQKILDACMACVYVAHQIITGFIFAFAAVCIPVYFLGGTLLSSGFNNINLYFNVATLTGSIGLPALVLTLHSTEKLLPHNILSLFFAKESDSSRNNGSSSELP